MDDTLKGLIYWETAEGIEKFCAAVEDPKKEDLTHILICKGKPENDGRKISNKRGRNVFKAFKFRDLEEVKNVERSIEKFIPNIPDDMYIRVSISELKKLGIEWIN